VRNDHRHFNAKAKKIKSATSVVVAVFRDCSSNFKILSFCGDLLYFGLGINISL